jgi:hypothetical protein
MLQQMTGTWINPLAQQIVDPRDLQILSLRAEIADLQQQLAAQRDREALAALAEYAATRANP